MSIKGFLFDVDGVLYDSMPQHAKSWVQAFKEYGMKLPAKLVYWYEGVPEVTAVESLALEIGKKLSTSDQIAIVERKRCLFNAYRKPKFIKGARQLIEYLKKQKLKICLVTGSYQLKTISRIEEDFGITRRGIITGKEVRRGKPHPEPFLKALRKLNLHSNQAVAVENAPLGITSAKRAGLRCVALTTGLLSRKDLEESRPDWVWKDCVEIIKKINSLFEI